MCTNALYRKQIPSFMIDDVLLTSIIRDSRIHHKMYNVREKSFVQLRQPFTSMLVRVSNWSSKVKLRCGTTTARPLNLKVFSELKDSSQFNASVLNYVFITKIIVSFSSLHIDTPNEHRCCGTAGSVTFLQFVHHQNLHQDVVTGHLNMVRCVPKKIWVTVVVYRADAHLKPNNGYRFVDSQELFVLRFFLSPESRGFTILLCEIT